MVDAAERDRLAEARRHDRRADIGEHRRRARDRRRAARLPLHLRDERQDERREDRAVAIVRAEVVVCPTAVPPEDPRSLLLDRRTARARDARCVPPRPVLEPGQPARARTHHRPRDLGADRGRVTHFVAGIGTGGTITGVARARCKCAQAGGADHRRRPVGFGVLRWHRPSVPRRRCRRRLLADHVRSRRSSTASSKSATPSRSSWRAA